MTLEVAAPGSPLDPKQWIDPTTLAKAGISAAEAAVYAAPPPYTGPSPLPQPEFDATKPHMAYPRDVYLKMLKVPDAQITAGASYAEPPVPA